MNREIKDTLYGYYLPPNLSSSEIIRLCFSDLHTNINEYRKRTEAQNRKKIAKQIHYVSSKLIDKINDPLNINMSIRYYNKKLDLFSEPLFSFINDTTRILEGLEYRTSKLEDFDYTNIDIDFISILKQLNGNGKGDKVDFQLINPFIGSLLATLGLPPVNSEKKDDGSALKRFFNYPFMKTISIASIYLITYLSILFFVKPEITMDTKWQVGGMGFFSVVLPFLILEIRKYLK